ncbi:TPA: RHS repeat-associated core domain-containing protein [Aeromonas hydrophila]|uniref:RHS repeat-associated core domain-containing protein n=1 Tax=Aeromonas hydrophila TaxID=644 RepID=UPI0038CFB5DF
MSDSNEGFLDVAPPNIARRTFILRASVLTTSAALLTLSPAGRVLAGWAVGPGEMPEAVGRMLLQENCLAFNGERRDPVAGLYHLGQGYRAYDPRMMRFHAADSLSPFGEGGINPYGYCLGDPINAVDSTGHLSWQAGLGIGLGILGIIISIVTLGQGIAAGIALVSAGGAISASAIATTTFSIAASVLGIASSATGVASSALEESNPQLSASLGWASLGLGTLGFVSGLGAARSASMLSRSIASPKVTYNAHLGRASLRSISVSSNLTNKNSTIMGAGIIGSVSGTAFMWLGDALDIDALRYLGAGMMGASAFIALAGVRIKSYRSALSSFAANGLDETVYFDNYRRAIGPSNIDRRFINSVDRRVYSDFIRSSRL